MEKSFIIKSDDTVAAEYILMSYPGRKGLFTKDGVEYSLLDGVLAANSNADKFHGPIYAKLKDNVLTASKKLQQLVDEETATSS